MLLTCNAIQQLSQLSNLLDQRAMTRHVCRHCTRHDYETHNTVFYKPCSAPGACRSNNCCPQHHVIGAPMLGNRRLLAATDTTPASTSPGFAQGCYSQVRPGGIPGIHNLYHCWYHTTVGHTVCYGSSCHHLHSLSHCQC